MKRVIVILAALLFGPALQAQDNTFHIAVLSYEWTTTHNPVTFSWPGHAETSCNGSADMSGYVSGGGNISASGTTSSTCSTTYTPPSNQTIDVRKPVVFILAETETTRMVLTCTRNVRWSQCHALNPGLFLARNDKGHFEVEGVSGKGKEEWIKFDIVQQTAVSSEQSQTPPTQEAHASIEAPSDASGTSDSNSGFPKRWKSMTTGTVLVLRFEGEYIYGEAVLPEAARNAGAFTLLEVKKDGDKYVGNTNGRMVVLRLGGGPSCSVSGPIELTLVTPDRIEGRSFRPPLDAKIDWNRCAFSPPANWQTFIWIPVR